MLLRRSARKGSDCIRLWEYHWEGGDISWEASVNAIACRAYALELAARAARNFNVSKGQHLDNKAVQLGTQYKLNELRIRIADRVATLESQLNTLQSALAEGRYRGADNLISPGTGPARTGIAQAINNAYGPEQIGDDGQLRVVNRAIERYNKLGVTAGIMRYHKKEEPYLYRTGNSFFYCGRYEEEKAVSPSVDAVNNG